MAERTPQEDTRLQELRAMTVRDPAEDAEMERLAAMTAPGGPGVRPSPASPPAPAAADGPMVLSVGQYLTVALSFVDGLEKQLGAMAAPGLGSATASEPNVVNVTPQLVGDTVHQVILRFDAINVGKTVVAYRNDEIAVDIPVEVVRRKATSVVVSQDSVSRYPLP